MSPSPSPAVTRSTKAQTTSAPTATSRSPRAPEATKRQILDAAEEEFAKRGLGGARTEVIANLAGVAPRMIYYYFQSKEGLYQAVLQRPVSEFQDALRELNLDGLPAEEALRVFLQTTIPYEVAHRYRGMLLFQEANQNQGKYFKLTNWEKPLATLTGILERGRQEGVFRELEPYMTTLAIAGVCTFYANAHENLKHLTPDQDLLSAELIERYTQAAIDLVLRGILRSAE